MLCSDISRRLFISRSLYFIKDLDYFALSGGYFRRGLTLLFTDTSLSKGSQDSPPDSFKMEDTTASARSLDMFPWLSECVRIAFPIDFRSILPCGSLRIS